MKYETLSIEEMSKLNVGHTIRQNFMLMLLQMYEEAVDDYNKAKKEEELKNSTDDDIFNY